MIYKVSVEYLGIWKPYCFPSPIEVIKKLCLLVANKAVFIAVFWSLKRMVIGYLISVFLGIIIGIMLIKSSYYDSIISLIIGIQALPSVCWLPFAILWFGLNESAIIFVIVMGSIFSTAMSIDSSIRNVHQDYIKTAKILGATGFKMYLNVLIPAALPNIIVGMKQAWSFAWRALMAGEMLIVSVGLGQILMVGREMADISQVIVAMIIIIFIGLLVNKYVFEKIEYNIRKKWGFADKSAFQ